MAALEAHPFVAGWDAYAYGVPRSMNPHPAGSLAAGQWYSGYDEHQGPDKRSWPEKRRDFLDSQRRESPTPWWTDR